MSLSTNQKPVVVSLGRETVAVARHLAQETHRLYKDSLGHYGDNSLPKHFIGKLGEAAVSALFQNANLKVKENFSEMDQLSRSDVAVRIRRTWTSLEVKTFSENRWREYGRVVAMSQLKNIHQNSDFIFWCSTLLPECDQTTEVKIMGYSPVSVLLDPSLHCRAYKPETVQLLESSLRHPKHFCDDFKNLLEAKRDTRLAERQAWMVLRCQIYRNTPSVGKHTKLLRQSLHARHCISGCIEAGF